jgi:eukaryotic-like serine/threonine-protein kinase
LAFEEILVQYKDVVLLKQGGQKAAYRAVDSKHGVVVVKLGQASSPQALERIRREVSTLQQIDSGYYPRQIDFQSLSDGGFFIVEEYVPSRPLSECLTEYTEPARALFLLKHVVEGLDLLFRRRIVHRDVKPDNLLIPTDGGPLKIIDLGIARLMDAESLTQTINASGPCTPGYAAPEQLKNRKARIDPRADQFSLGIVFLQLLLGGCHPFDPAVVGRGDSIVVNILADAWARPALAGLGLPEPWCALASGLLGNEPFRRFRDSNLLRQKIAECEKAS